MRSLPAELAGVASASLADPGAACDVLILAVPDDAIAGVAATLAPRLSCRVALHLSGALSSRILEPLREPGRGDRLDPSRAALHRGSRRGLEWGLRRGRRRPGAEPGSGRGSPGPLARSRIRLEPGAKPLYHASASLAAGGAAAVLSVAVRGWVAAGIPEDVAREALADLAVRQSRPSAVGPFAEAFTGPWPAATSARCARTPPRSPTNLTPWLSIARSPTRSWSAHRAADAKTEIRQILAQSSALR